MTYYLMQMVLSSPGRIELADNEYMELIRSCGNLLQALYLEEKFDVLLANFVELETDLLAAGARDFVYRDYDPNTKRIERNFLVNRRFLNLLTSCRAYLDQGTHDLKAISLIKDGASAGLDRKFKELTSQYYDSRSSYQIMDAVRNYTQHRGFPIRTTYDRSWVDTVDGPSMAFCVMPKFDLTQLRADPKFKQKSIEFLGREKEEINAMPLVREYIEALCLVHIGARQSYAPILDESKQMIDDNISKYVSKFGESSRLGLAAVEIENERFNGDPVYLLGNNIKYLTMLTKKNSQLDRISKCFVSGNKLPISRKFDADQ